MRGGACRSSRMREGRTFVAQSTGTTVDLTISAEVSFLPRRAPPLLALGVLAAGRAGLSQSGCRGRARKRWSTAERAGAAASAARFRLADSAAISWGCTAPGIYSCDDRRPAGVRQTDAPKRSFARRRKSQPSAVSLAGFSEPPLRAIAFPAVTLPGLQDRLCMSHGRRLPPLCAGKEASGGEGTRDWELARKERELTLRQKPDCTIAGRSLRVQRARTTRSSRVGGLGATPRRSRSA